MLRSGSLVIWRSEAPRFSTKRPAPYSFFNAFNYDPPILGFASIAWKDSVKNVSETGEFVWNLVTKDLGDQTNRTAAPVPHGVSEFDVAGWRRQQAGTSKYPVFAKAVLRWNARSLKLSSLRTSEARR